MEIKYIVDQIEYLAKKLSNLGKEDEESKKFMSSKLNYLCSDLVKKTKKLEQNSSSNLRPQKCHANLRCSYGRALRRARKDKLTIQRLHTKIDRLQDSLLLAESELKASKNKVKLHGLTIEEVYQELLKTKAELLTQYQASAYSDSYKQKSQLFSW